MSAVETPLKPLPPGIEIPDNVDGFGWNDMWLVLLYERAEVARKKISGYGKMEVIFDGPLGVIDAYMLERGRRREEPRLLEMPVYIGRNDVLKLTVDVG